MKYDVVLNQARLLEESFPLPHFNLLGYRVFHHFYQIILNNILHRLQKPLQRKSKTNIQTVEERENFSLYQQSPRGKENSMRTLWWVKNSDS